MPTSTKTAAKPAAAPATKAASPAPKAAAAPAKTKQKLVRDSFTIPKAEYAVLDDLKQRATRLGQPAKKGELLRAGLKALSGMSDKGFLAALQAVPTLKTGRPKLKPTAPAKAPPAKP